MTANVCAPAASAEYATGDTQRVAALRSSEQAKLTPASALAKVNSAKALVADAAGALVSCAFGAVVSTVQE